MTFDLSDIERYTLGQLNAEELILFENELQKNAVLRKDLQTYTEMNSFLSIEKQTALSINSLRERHHINIQNTETSTKIKPNSSSILRRTLLLFLLAIITAVVVYLFIRKDDASINPEILYASYFDPSTVSLNTRGAVDQMQYSKIADFFNAGNYQETLAAINLLDKDVYNAQLQYISGISLIALDKSEEGRNVLLQLAERSALYVDDVNWYVGLSYIKDNQKNQAVGYLSKIDKSSAKFAKTQELLNKIQNL